jgi:SAM-dependent methyltransferase
VSGRVALGEDSEILYRGRIRAGAAGALTADEHIVRRCREYDVAFLEAGAPAVDYESDAYREAYDGSAEVAEFHRLHAEQARRHLRLVEGLRLDGSVIADFGCGAGTWLELVRGVAAETIGIEPHARFRAELARAGHRAYAYAGDLLRDGGAGSVDLAVAFHVVEHVADPRAFLREMRDCLRPGGAACLATPNLHDFLLELVGEPYRRHYFRTAHRWYFSGGGLARLAGEAGFGRARIGYLQEYDLGNAFAWLRESRPRGNGTLPELGAALESAWTARLEAAGRANVVYLVAERA